MSPELSQAVDPRHEHLLIVLDAVGLGALILDGVGRVVRANRKARSYLGAELDTRRRAAVPDLDLTINRRIQLALRDALRTSAQLSPQLGDLIAVPRVGARPLLLRSIRLYNEGRVVDTAMAALIVFDLEDCVQPDDDVLREVFLLTPAEIRLAKRLACGESLSDIADRLGVTLGTLRTQLKALFWKTGTSRQGELISLLCHVARLRSVGDAVAEESGPGSPPS